VFKGFWGIVGGGGPEGISGNYRVAEMSGKVVSAEELLQFEVWALFGNLRNV